MILFFIFTLIFTFSPLTHTKASFTILLDPAGDIHATGRKVHDTFEHGLTMQCAQAVQKKIKEYNSDIRVLISRTPGEYIEPLQTANFANRLNVDCFVHISFFAQDTNYSIAMYRYSTDPTDDWNTIQLHSLTTIPLHKAHMLHHDASNTLLQTMYNLYIKDTSLHWLTINQPMALPYKPLMGIISPAIALEIGIPDSQSWRALIDPLAEFLCKTVEQYYDSTNKV